MGRSKKWVRPLRDVGELRTGPSFAECNTSRLRRGGLCICPRCRLLQRLLGIPGVFGLSFAYNPVFDEFFNAVNNNFNPEFARNYYQQRGFTGNQNLNGNYDQNSSFNYNNNNFQQQPQQNVNYRDTKIYDV